MELSLSGKTALVCGASQGIGAATAKELAALGARVILLARNAEKLETVKSSLANPHLQHQTIAVDIAQRVELTKHIKNAISAFGPITILINNTGGPAAGPVTEATEQDFLATFEKHVLVNSLLAQLLLPGMKEQKYGRILNVISTSVKVPIPGLGVSNTIRAAVANWAKTLSQEVASFGITVNSVLPGMTKTERLESLIQGTSQKQQKAREDVEKSMLATIPAGRFAEASEVAAAIAFLATPAAAYINGVALAVDGGRTGCL